MKQKLKGRKFIENWRKTKYKIHKNYILNWTGAKSQIIKRLKENITECWYSKCQACIPTPGVGESIETTPQWPNLSDGVRDWKLDWTQSELEVNWVHMKRGRRYYVIGFDIWTGVQGTVPFQLDVHRVWCVMACEHVELSSEARRTVQAISLI